MDVQPITVPQSLAYVLNTAGDKSNVDFDYLLKTAMRESSLDPDAKAPSSSAVGLFQFLDTTWLQVMKEEGPRLGYQKYADAITKGADGNYEVKNKALRAEILNLRKDPQVAADMAAAFTESNGQYLEAKFGRMPSPGELYIAHFLGPQGAEKMFDAGLKNPDQVAASLFPSAAKANPQIFYDGKHARTIREVYKALVAQHNAIQGAPLPGATDPAFAAQQLAGTSAPGAGPIDATNPAAVPPITPKDMSFSALFANGRMPPPGTPLLGTEAAAPIAAAQPAPDSPGQSVLTPVAPDDAPPQSLAAIDAAAGAPQTGVDTPLPAPAPLVAPLALADSPQGSAAPDQPDVAPVVPVPVPVAPAPPKARVEISPGVMPNPAFFTQLLWQDGDGP